MSLQNCSLCLTETFQSRPDVNSYQTNTVLLPTQHNTSWTKYLKRDVPEIKISRTFVKRHNWLCSLFNYDFTSDVSRRWTKIIHQSSQSNVTIVTVVVVVVLVTISFELALAMMCLIRTNGMHDSFYGLLQTKLGELLQDPLNRSVGLWRLTSC